MTGQTGPLDRIIAQRVSAPLHKVGDSVEAYRPLVLPLTLVLVKLLTMPLVSPMAPLTQARIAETERSYGVRAHMT